MAKIFLTALLTLLLVTQSSLAQVKARSKTFSISPSVKPAILSAMAEFSEPSGNNFLDAGEKGTLKVTILNTGGTVAKNVLVELTTSGSFSGVTFTPFVRGVDNIAPNASAVCNFEIMASETVPSQIVTFALKASDSSGVKIEPKSFTISTKERLIAKGETPPVIEILEPKELTSRGIGLPADSAITVRESSIKIRGIAKDPSGVAIVRINEREATLKPTENGVEFTGEVLLTFGVNPVEIVAVDKYSNRAVKTFVVRREVVVAKEPEKPLLEKPFQGYQVWAAIIGISNYQSPDIPQLRYADRDAEEFYQFLITPLEKGGRGVSKSNIRRLINREATKTNIQEAIFDFMKNAIEEDVVFIYFAGHGAPDPARPNVPYLLAYDSDLKRPAATAVKMSEIQDAIKDYIKAKKVIVFADACHSAGVSTSIALRGLAESELINQFLEEIAKAGNSVLTFSASEAKEYSQESPQWGGGHGVFTYHILEGLKGKADVDGDRIVRLGELVDYVNQNVRRDTQSQQHPTASPTLWDRNLPMSIVVEKK